MHFRVTLTTLLAEISWACSARRCPALRLGILALALACAGTVASGAPEGDGKGSGRLTASQEASEPTDQPGEEGSPQLPEAKTPDRAEAPATAGTLKRVEVGRHPGFRSQSNYRVIPGSDYVVDAYDRLDVAVRGAKPDDWLLQVSPHGIVTVPLIGAIRCSGMTVSALEKLLARELRRYLREFTVSVSVARLRGIQVTVAGQVQSPGSYSLPGLSTLWDALQEAGGITQAGSVRNARIRDRLGKERSLDLYPFLFGGRDECNPALKPGDTIVIPVAERIVGLSGEVRGPGLYEFGNGESLSQLLVLGGGTTAQAAPEKAYLRRTLPDRTNLIIPVNLSASQPQAPVQDLHDGDVLVVPPAKLFLGSVHVYGEVRQPGRYDRAENMRLRDLLDLAGGCTPAGLPAKAYIQRVRQDGAVQVLWVDAAKAASGAPDANIELCEGDWVTIPAATAFAGSVAVGGAVMKELKKVPLAQAMTVRDLLGLAGGLAAHAAPSQAYIERVAGLGGPKRLLWLDADRAQQGDTHENIALMDGDVLTIPAMQTYLGRVSATGELRALVSTPLTRSTATGAASDLASAAGADTRAGNSRRAEFQLSQGMRVSDMVKLAGGPTAMAALQRARLVRVGAHGIRESAPLNLESILANVGSAEDVALRDGDELEVPSISVLQKTVRVAGEVVGTGIFEQPAVGPNGNTVPVKRRGLYELKEGDRVRDLIQAVGGVTANAALRAARIDRQGPDGKMQRIAVDLQRLLVDRDEAANLPLQNGDEFTVPAIADMVYIVGAVSNPGGYEYREGNARVMDMISRAGGQTPRAILTGVRLVRGDANGKQEPIRVDMDAVMKHGKVHLDPGVRAGDVVIVPEKPIMMQDIFQMLANVSLLRFYFNQ